MIRVELNQNDAKKIFRNLDNIMTTAEIEAINLPRREAIEFSNLIISRIEKGRSFMAGYKPYTKRYAKWKELNYPGREKQFWYLHGDLVRAVKPHQMTTGVWLAGVHPSAYDSGGKSWLAGFMMSRDGKQVTYTPQTRGPRQIAMYGAVNEHLRPLFGPTEDDYSTSSMRSTLHKKAILAVLRKWTY